MRISTLILAAGSALALGGCAYGDLGYGVGYGYGYGYGSPYYGYDYGYPYGGYGYGGSYYGLGYGYGSPYYGWYDNYYYPGTGYYVYDTYRRPHRWSDRQRDYWTRRMETANRTRTSVVRPTRPDWSAFNRQQMRSDRQQIRADRQQLRADRRVTREQARAARQDLRDLRRVQDQQR